MSGETRILALFGSAVIYGAERGNVEALAALKGTGCDVLCLIRDEAWNALIPPLLEARGLAWRKAPYIEHRIPGGLWRVLLRNPMAFLRANWCLFRIARVYRPTHIHAYSQLFVLNFILTLAVLRTPMIYRAGDEPTRHNLLWRASWRFLIWRASRFVANSEFVARSLVASGVRSDRVTVIRNAPPTRTGLTAEPFALPLPPSARVFAFVGQIAAHKGPHLLIEAFRLVCGPHPEACLAIAGRISEWVGDDWARALRRQVLNDPALRDRIVFLGPVENVPGLLACCECIVVPSLFDDPSPNVVIEAKLAGRPAIGFPSGGIPELVEHDVDGMLCAQATASALAAALTRYLEDPSTAERHGIAARASLDSLGSTDFAARWRDVYRVDVGDAAEKPNPQRGKIRAAPEVRLSK